MAEVDRALDRVKAATKRMTKAESDHAVARKDRDAALLEAQAARATWDEMMQAAQISRPTLQKALKR